MRASRTLLFALLLTARLATAQSEAPVPAAASAPDAATDAGDAEEGGPAIAEVRVKGNRRVEKDAVLSVVATRKGQEIDAARLRDDINAIWRLGFFSDVAVDVTEEEKGPVVTFIVEEKPAVHAVRYAGNDELSENDLKEVVDVRPFSILDEEALRQNVKKIQDKYVSKGFYLAFVSYKLEPVPGGANEVDVIFVIEEHAKVEVRRITFIGAKQVPEDDLKAVMQTRESGLFSWLTQSGTYKEEDFERDLLVVQGVYYDRGYINVRVGRPSITLSPDKKYLFISIPVEEGEQYALGALGFSGDIDAGTEGDATSDKLWRLLSIKTGETFSRTKLQKDLFALSDLFRDQGYAYVNVTPLTAVHPKQKTVDITFDVQKGPRVTIERIEISGNTKTRDKVIRRELRVYEGELYSGTGIKNSRQRVTALGYFESVDITTERGSRPDTMLVRVTVKEKATGTFQLGFGFSNVENFILTGQLAQNNLFGWGWNGAFSIQWSKLRQIFDLSWTDPYFLDTSWTLAFSAFNTLQGYEGFNRGALGFDLTGGYELFEDFRLFTTYGLESVDIEPTRAGQEVILANRFQGGITSSVRLSANWDRRDNRLFPSKGFLLSGSAEFAPSWLGSENLFNRYRGVARYYVPGPWGMVLKLNASLAYIAGGRVPISELFFVGGINTVRGYRLRSLSPTIQVARSPDPGAPLLAFPIGGNKEAVFNVELEFPIFEAVGIRGVVFFDAGNAFGVDQALFSRRAEEPPLGLFKSVGLGFRWFSPIGPLRFEWGFPLDGREARPGIEADLPYLFEFSVGNPF